ncbi:MAG TPA: hypothetical protein VER96_19620 [Polyangiaceae bacterium]|nr:hypothetical protein [Polyangiaceae bacterium]
MMLVIAVSVALCAPLFRMDWFAGHEGYSYVLRTLEWAQELRAGSIYPRWCPDFYGGYGSPLFLFYGPVIYGSAGVLTATFLSPFMALKVATLFFSVLCGAGTYALIYGETRHQDASFLGTMAYMASPYRNGNLYARGDLGEFSCIAILPVVIALYRAAAREALPNRARLLAVAAAATHGVMIMSHPVMGLWGTLVVGLIVLSSLVPLWVAGMRQRAVTLVVAVACAPGLAGVYVLPAMSYRTLTRTADMIVGFYKPQDQLTPLWQLFGVHSHPLFGPNFLSVGYLVAAATIASVLVLIVNFRKARGLLGWLALTFFLVFLTHPVSHWFWAPDRLPLTQFIQFPWRLFGPISLTSSIALGVALAHSRLSEPLKSGAAIACSTAFFLFTSWPFLTQQEISPNNTPQDPDSIRVGIYSATDANEYHPLSAGDFPREPRAELVQSAEGVTVQYTSSDGSKHSLGLKAEQANAEVKLGVYFFPGWTMNTISGPAKAQLLADENGRLKVRLPVAGEYRVRVQYGASPAGKIGGWLTAISALVLLLLGTWKTGLWPWPIPRLRAVGGAK